MGAELCQAQVNFIFLRTAFITFKYDFFYQRSFVKLHKHLKGEHYKQVGAELCQAQVNFILFDLIVNV